MSEGNEGRIPAVDSDVNFYDPSQMKKKELISFALVQFAEVLDPEEDVKELRAKVTALLDKARKKEGLPTLDQAKKQRPKELPKFLRHPQNGRVYAYTPQLAARGDMIACDKDGNSA